MAYFSTKTILSAASLAFLALATLGAAHATDGYYGTFYYNKETGAYGYSYNYDNADEAEQRAYNECASFGAGCRHIVTFQGCGAFAEWRSEDGEYVYGYSYDYDTLMGALDRAMQECMDRNDGFKCGIIMYACND